MNPRNPNQQGTPPGGAGPGAAWQQPAPPPQQDPGRDPGNVTLFRTNNFFVHAFTPLRKTGSLLKADGSATVLERIRWVSVEKQRLEAAQTRLLPQTETVNQSLLQEITVSGWVEAVVVVLVLCIMLAAQVINIFHYPAYTADEGTYMSNAWAILHGKITPYAYTYDHPPVGWLLIALWAQLTGGIASFGNAINSGRVLMLLLAAASSIFLYLITSRLSASRSAALLAMVLYTLSPLSLSYRHEVLLDNIGTFWLLLSLCLITTGKSRLGTFVFAGIALGLAILSKEIFVIFVPAMLYAVWLFATEFQRKFSFVTFFYVTLVVASVYILLALLQGELFPPGLLPGDKTTHASLIGSFLQKWHTPLTGGQFITSWNTWLRLDMVLFLGGTIAMFINILGGTVNRLQLLAALFVGSFWLFLLSSNVIYPFYVIPLLPFLALNIAQALNTPIRWITKKVGFDLLRALIVFALIGMLIPAGVQRASSLLQPNLAEPQQQAMLWIRNNIPHNAVIISDSQMFTDLREPGGMAVGSGTPFAHAQIYSQAVLDPQVYYKDLNGDWQKIDFIAADATMLREIRTGSQYTLLNEALHHAIPRASFGSSQDGTQVQIFQVIHT
jgi:Dolichyl-phosphate-mannose-protein mannosyltransferase